jgi:hypothetical protein
MVTIKASPALSEDEEMAATAVNNAAICANLIVMTPEFTSTQRTATPP